MSSDCGRGYISGSELELVGEDGWRLLLWAETSLYACVPCLTPTPVNLVSATAPQTCSASTFVLTLDLKAGLGHSGDGVVEGSGGQGSQHFRALVALPHSGVGRERSSGLSLFGVSLGYA